MKRSGRRQFDNKDWEAVKKRYKYRCLRCKTRENPNDPSTALTADHVIPVSMGGRKGIENIQPLCKACNWIKGTSTTDYRWGKPVEVMLKETKSTKKHFWVKNTAFSNITGIKKVCMDCGQASNNADKYCSGKNI